MTVINEVLRKFDEEFQSVRSGAATTWQWDVDAVYCEGQSNSLANWALALPENFDIQHLNAMRLKWFMDVDETFYIGEQYAAEKFPGLLNGDFEDKDGESILLDFGTFGLKYATNVDQPVERPCKWLEIVKKTSFRYKRARLVFRLSWPQLVENYKGNKLCYVGGIAPLLLKASD